MADSGMVFKFLADDSNVKKDGSKGYKDLIKHSKTLSLLSKETKNNLASAFSKGAVIGWAYAIKTSVDTMLKATKKQTEYIENLNMMKVAFGDTAESAEAFVNKLSGKIGFDTASLTKQLGIFRQISSAMGYTANTADLLSKNLAKMALDISSLYNVDLDRANKALESALTGQVKTIRAMTGADITQAALKQEALALGIDKSVTSMSRAEKAILIYLSLEKQLSNANGDLSKTINSVANQAKIFKDQIGMLGRQISGFLIPVLKKLLPIINGILMVFNELVGMLLGILGIDASSIADEFKIASSGIENLEDGLDGVASASDKAKKSLRGFDKLNNITTSDKSSGTSGGGVGLSGIDAKLLAKLDEYNLQLDKMKNKATKIKESIMKILGFHKELNEETGQWEWKYNGVTTTIKNLYTEFKKLSTPAKIVVGTITTLAAIKTVSNIAKIFSAFKNGVTPVKKLSEAFSVMDKLNFSNLKASVDGWKDSLTFAEKLQGVLLGSAGIVAGLALTKDGIKKAVDEGKTGIGILETGLGGLSSVIGGAVAGGAVAGAAGGIIGGTLAGIGFIAVAIDDLDTHLTTNIEDIKKTKTEVDKLYGDWQKSIEEIQETYKTADVESDYYKRLWEELKNITDENGKIKTGYEDRAKTITTILSDALGIEISVVDGNIEKWKELQGEIDNYINKRKNAMKLATLEDAATNAMKQLDAAQQSVLNSANDLENAQNKLKDKISQYSTNLEFATEDVYKYIQGQMSAEEMASKYGKSVAYVTEEMQRYMNWTKKQRAALIDAENNYNNANKALDGYRQTIRNYETALGLSLSNNQEALDKFFDHEQYLYGKSFDEQKTYWEDRKKLNELSLSELEKNREKYTEGEYNALKKSYEDDLSLIGQEMDKIQLLIDTKNGNLSADVVKKWTEMGNNSVTEFTNVISTLPDEVQKNLAGKMRSSGETLSKELQEGLEKIKPTIGIEIQYPKEENVRKMLKNKGLSDALIDSTIELAKKHGYQFRADGGFVNSGDIFVANENNRPEYVGSFGNQTAVANTDQIVDGIAIGVTRAMMAVGANKDTKVVIEAKGDASGLMDFITFEQRKKDRQYGL